MFSTPRYGHANSGAGAKRYKKRIARDRLHVTLRTNSTQDPFDRYRRLHPMGTAAPGGVARTCVCGAARYFPGAAGFAPGLAGRGTWDGAPEATGESALGLAELVPRARQQNLLTLAGRDVVAHGQRRDLKRRLRLAVDLQEYRSERVECLLEPLASDRLGPCGSADRAQLEGLGVNNSELNEKAGRCSCQSPLVLPM